MSAEVRFFEFMDILNAAEWARSGGIAVHRNFDLDGIKVGIKVREGVAWHVLSSDREALVAWGKKYGQRESWLQGPRTRGLFEGIWHYDVFGAPGRRLLRESGQEAA